MKLFLYCLIALFFWSCSQDKTKEQPKEKKSKIINNRLYKDSYPNGQTKITGSLDNKGKKEGVWTSYFENGNKNSESVFKNGLNNGYSIVWYPNGNIMYFGDYTNGNRSGKWTFYNEDGETTRTESY